MAAATLFDLARFESLLHSAAIGRRVVYRTTIDTTMFLARETAAAGAPHGTLVLAEEQTAGRGRRGRGFHSPAGENLYFTLVLRLSSAAARALPVAVPFAVCRAVAATGVGGRIKWPNDIWAGERKLCGMLIDAESGSAGLVAFPGIGINVNGDPTQIPELREIATSIRRELGHPIDREALLAAICDNLEDALATPLPDLVAMYRDLSLLLGRTVLVQPSSGTAFSGVARDIDVDGSLIVERGGRLETVTAADVSVRPL